MVDVASFIGNIGNLFAEQVDSIWALDSTQNKDGVSGSGVVSPTLLSAARIRSEAVGSVKLAVYTDNSKTTRVESFFDNIDSNLFYETEHDVFLQSRAYWVVEKEVLPSQGGMVINSIRRISPGNVTKKDDQYTITTSKGVEQVSAENMVIFNSYDNRKPDVILQDYLDLERQALRGKAKNSTWMNSPRYLYQDRTFNAKSLEEKNKFAQEFKQLYNIESELPIVFITDKAKFTPLPVPEDKETPKTILMVRQAVSAYSGVPSQWIGSAEGTTYLNLPAYHQYFWNLTIIPELKRLADAIKDKLYPDMYVEFDLTNVTALLEDKKSESDAKERAARATRNYISGIVEAKKEELIDESLAKQLIETYLEELA